MELEPDIADGRRTGRSAAGGRDDVPAFDRKRVDPDLYAEAVLAVVELIPSSRVLTYGDVAELLECGGPRQVGRALSRSTRDVPWWRVLRAGGHPAGGLAARARPHYDVEGTALSLSAGVDDPAIYRVDLAHARWQPTDSEYEVIAALCAALNQR